MSLRETDSEILSEIQRILENIRKEYLYETLTESFAHWIVQVALGFDGQEAFEATRVNGQGVDAFISEVGNDHVMRVFQINFTEENPYSKKWTSRELQSLNDALEWLSNGDLEIKGDRELVNAARDFRRGKAKNFDVIAFSVVFGRLTLKAREELESTREKWEKLGIEVRVLDIDGIRDAHLAWLTRESDERVDDEVKILLLNQERFVRPLQFTDTNGTQVLIISLPAKALIDLYEKYRYKLFDLNVRYFLGNTDASRAMRETLENPKERPLFFAYNNGMTILCEEFSLLNKGSELRIKAPQIVNGCQTTVALYESKHQIDDSVAILARIINSRTEVLSQHIAESTNTQSAVTHRDLRANDVVQRVIQNRFNSLSPPYMYLRKRGEWKKLTSEEKQQYRFRRGRGHSYRKVENETLAQAYLSFIGKPMRARTEKQKLFVIRGGYYNEIFDNDRSAEEYLLPFRLLEYVEQQKAKFRVEFRQALKDVDKLEKSEIRTWTAKSAILYATYTIVGLMGYLIVNHYSRKGAGYNKDVAVSVLSKFDEIAEPLYRICSRQVQRYTNTIMAVKPDYDISNAHKRASTFADLVGEIDIDLSADPMLTSFLPHFLEE
ncbi:MAG: AIPR family protein [Candidatus Thorarchaeota archaeon]